MSGIMIEEPGVDMSQEEVLSRQQIYQSGSLVEWRSSEQIENGAPSTSPPSWNSDEDDGAPKPSDLYGKHTWKIDKFSQVNKRELRSDAFEIGGYNWYILIYPQGCDVCNHLSLFLCVANHDKLLPGWSHFAQFTIAVVNKDPKKSKYSDTLHRFWKKEHDWGWKKFMELSKMMDGFIDADTLIIKAQVQVIRERADRPFRCLDCHYRRELVRVYLTNVEQICRRFVEECRSKLGGLIEDKAKWSSFCAFWLGMDLSSRRCMSQEKIDSILKFLVKHFFIEKEVTSTLVMDSLYSGLKALKGQSKGMKINRKYLEAEEVPVPVICIEKETIALVDDVLLLLERAAMEPLPPKDEKGPQNRTKDGASGEEFNKDSLERDERRLTELGRRTIEIFVLAHVFSKIEVAYQEAVSLKRQEELIREEEAACLADIEQKMKCGALDKERKSKKKQGKQRRNNRKGKDKGKDDKVDGDNLQKIEQNDPTPIIEKELLVTGPEMMHEKLAVVDDVSDASPDSEDREDSLANWDADMSEMHSTSEANGSEIAGFSCMQNEVERISLSTVDDSSSTCSTESVLPVVINVAQNSSSRNHKFQKHSNSGRNHQRKATPDSAHLVNEELIQPTEIVPDAGHLSDICQNSKFNQSITKAAARPLRDKVNGIERNVAKEELHRNQSVKNVVKAELSGDRTYVMSPPSSPSRGTPSIVPTKLESKMKVANIHTVSKRPSSSNPEQADGAAHLSITAENVSTLKLDAPKLAPSKPVENPSLSQTLTVSEKLPTQHAQFTNDKPSTSETLISRPLSAPIFPAPRPSVSVVSVVQTAPILARSVSATGRLGPEATVSSTSSYVPQSYRNAIVGNLVTGNSSAYIQNHSSSPMITASHPHSLAPVAPFFSSHSSDRTDTNSVSPIFPFGMLNHPLQTRHLWMENSQTNNRGHFTKDQASLINDMQRFDLCDPLHSRSEDNLSSKLPTCTSGRQNHVSADEFPHIDIINDLLDDENGIGMGSRSNNSCPHSLNRQYSFPRNHPGMSSGAGQSSGSCRFERSHSYLDGGFQHVNGLFSRNPHDPSLDFLPWTSPQSYVNGVIDDLIPNQWLTMRSDISHPSVRKIENDGYPYHVPAVSNLSFGANGYTVFRPSNGL